MMGWLLFVFMLFGTLSSAHGEAGGPTITAIHPSTECVPANLLRIYLSFSEPMARGDAMASVSLFDNLGKEVESPFLNLNTELWTADQTTLTLLLDPGRIKQGVGPNLIVGAPLSFGNRYTLVVSAPLQAAGSGKSLKKLRKEFCVVEAERRPLGGESWSVSKVRAGTAGSLSITFDRLVDFGSTFGRLAVTTGKGHHVDGQMRLGTDNRTVEFYPKAAWEDVEYMIVAHESLEDVAGNRFSAAFDSVSPKRRNPSSPVSLSFSPVVAE